ncbi:MAG TPA: DoxX family protein [Chloroflexota bacterium]
MNIVLWIVQIVLAIAFALAGVMKVTQPKEKLAANMGWVEDFSQLQVRGIGVLELLAAIGLIVPAAIDILPALTPLAAVGLVFIMLGAAATHFRRHEPRLIGVNFVLLLLAVVVVVGRFVTNPIS